MGSLSHVVGRDLFFVVYLLVGHQWLCSRLELHVRCSVPVSHLPWGGWLAFDSGAVPFLLRWWSPAIVSLGSARTVWRFLFRVWWPEFGWDLDSNRLKLSKAQLFAWWLLNLLNLQYSRWRWCFGGCGQIPSCFRRSNDMVCSCLSMKTLVARVPVWCRWSVVYRSRWRDQTERDGDVSTISHMSFFVFVCSTWSWWVIESGSLSVFLWAWK